MRLSRRVFFWTLVALALLARFGQAISLKRATAYDVPVTVAILRSDSTAPSDGEIEVMVRQALQMAPGLIDLIQTGDIVVIKPNLVLDVSPETGMVTDTRVVRTLVRVAQELDAGQVYIAEGSARYSSGDPDRDRHVTRRAFQIAGYDLDGDMVDDVTGVPLVDLNISGEAPDARDPNYVTLVNVATGLIRKEYWLPNLILEADVLISVPVLKNHYLAGTTLGMKNMIGVAPNDIYHAPGHIYEKQELSHADVELLQHIVDLNLARRPDYVVIDGLRGMTDGPIGSQIIDPPMGLIISGQDVVAVDTVGTLIMGYAPASVAYLKMAQQVNLGTTNSAWIEVVGESVGQVRRDFPAPYGELPIVRADSQPPLVDIISPQDGVSLTGSARVLVEAVDDVGVASVEVYIDGLLVGIRREAPYDFTLAPEAYGPGPHTLRAEAYDRALNEVADTITINFPSPEPTSTGAPTVVAEIAATASPTAWPSEPAITPSSSVVMEHSATATVTRVTVTPERTDVADGPMSQETRAATAGPSSATRDDDVLLLGLLSVIVIAAIGVGTGCYFVTRTRDGPERHVT